MEPPSALREARQESNGKMPISPESRNAADRYAVCRFDIPCERRLTGAARVERALHAAPAFVHHVGVHHRRFDAVVAKQR